MNFTDRAPLSLDRDRVTCLLLINTHLIKKCCNIHNTMINNPQFMQQIAPENRVMLNNTYNHYIRRLQCNLATLNYLYEKYHTNQQQQQQQQQPKAIFPIILSAPQDMPELNQLYSKLQELYPEGVQYFKMKFEESRKQQQQQAFQQQQQQQQQQQSIPPQMPLQQQQQQQQPPQQQQQQHTSIPQQHQQMPQQQMMSQHTPQMLHQHTPQMMSQQPPPPQQQQQISQQQQQQQSFDDILLTDGFNSSGGNDLQGQNHDFNPNYSNGGVNNRDNGNGNNNNGMNSFSMSTLSPQQILQQANNGDNTPMTQDFLF
ncbi:hypothetical protein SBY92_004958 [Candida maltosa Xu316]